jgi:hypothetical protein
MTDVRLRYPWQLDPESVRSSVPPVSAGNVCVVLVIVSFLGSISGTAGCSAAQSFHKALQANG